MLKYIKNNQKKVMAFVGVFLMISFAVTTGSYNKSVASDHPIGTLYNGKTTLGSREYQHYNSQWRYLKERVGPLAMSEILGGANDIEEELAIKILGEPFVAEGFAQQASQLLSYRQISPAFFQRVVERNPQMMAVLGVALTGQQVYGDIEKNEDLFPLLVKEAQTLGVGVNADMVESILVRRGITKDDTDNYEAMQGALRNLLMVANAASRASSAVGKISRPTAHALLALQNQQISVDMITFDAKDYLEKVPAPTQQQLQEQFDKFKDVVPTGGALDFGYKYPDRVKYDAIVIKKDEVKKAVPAVQLDELYQYYFRNKNSREFITDKPASTRPEDQFTLDRGPTTRPMTFDEAKERIALKLANERIDQLTHKIRDAVRDTMKADYDAFRSATGGATRPTTAPASPLGVPYNSYEYLQKLRDKIQADFKVTPTIEQQQAWQDEKTLKDSIPDKDAFRTDASIPFAAYMTHGVEGVGSEDDKKNLTAARGDNKPVHLWEPTPIFKSDKDEILLARATQVSPSHSPASLDEVKDKVAADVKLAAAMEKARQAAQAALDSAITGSKWLQTVADEQKKGVITTGLYGPFESAATTVAGLDFKGPSLIKFVSESFKLLGAPPRSGQAPQPASRPSTQSTTRPTVAAAAHPATAPAPSTAPVALKEHPIGIIELPADAKVVVAEVREIKPAWSRDHQAEADTLVANHARLSDEQLMRALWFRYDNVIARVGYVAKEQKDRKPAQPQPPIDNPFQ